MLTPGCDDSVCFFNLGVLEGYVGQRYANAESEAQDTLRKFIAQWWRNQTVVMSGQYVRNKFAQIVCQAFLVDYPRRWPTFFHDLVQCALSLGPTSWDIYLRILTAINSEIADREIPKGPKEFARNTFIKDTMREQAVPAIVDSFYHILTCSDASSMNRSLCLQVIGAYISWIDLSLIACDRFMAFMHATLAAPVTSTDDVNVKESIAECLQEMVHKGMDGSAKSQLVASVFQLLSSAQVFTQMKQSAADDDIDYIVRVSKLINTMALELIDTCSKLIPRKKSAMEECNDATDRQVAACVMNGGGGGIGAPPIGSAATHLIVPSSALDSNDLLVSTQAFLESQLLTGVILDTFFPHSDDDVSGGVVECIREYLQFIKARQALDANQYGPIQREIINTLLYRVINKYKFDADYAFDKQGQDEAEFIEFRKSLKVIFDNIAQLDKDMVIRVTREVITKTLVSWRELPFQDVEVAVSLLYLLGETIPHTQHAQMLHGMIVEVVRSEVSCHPHSAVRLEFFETIARYDRVFAHEPQHIPDVLKAFLDERGLRSSDVHVRSRTSYLFAKFIKSLRNKLESYTEEILRMLSDLLFLPGESSRQARLSPDDQLYLYEAAAMLIMATQFQPEKKRQLLCELLRPVLESFEYYIRQMQLNATSHEMRQTTVDCMCHAIALTSRTSKAFSNNQTMKLCQCESVYINAIKGFTAALAIPAVDEGATLHSAVRQFFHRMIVCLDGADFLPLLPEALRLMLGISVDGSGSAAPPLFKPDMRALQECLPLINQAVAKFKGDTVPLFRVIFLPLVSLLFEQLTATLDANDLVALREKQMLQRAYFTFIGTLVSNEIIDKIISPYDGHHLDQVFQTIIHGAVNFPDPVAQKSCFNMMRKMVQLWGRNASASPEFVHFVYDMVLPACFHAPLRDTFDMSDAQTTLALGECVQCILDVARARDAAEFVPFVEGQLLPALGFTPAQIADTLSHLNTGDVKACRNFFKGLFMRMRGL